MTSLTKDDQNLDYDTDDLEDVMSVDDGYMNDDYLKHVELEKKMPSDAVETNIPETNYGKTNAECLSSYEEGELVDDPCAPPESLPLPEKVYKRP